mgnify:CR=1 FL=1|jgi:hypothetical protein
MGKIILKELTEIQLYQTSLVQFNQKYESLNWLISYWKIMLVIGLCGCIIALIKEK